MPAFAMRHGGVGDALHQVDAADGGGQKLVRAAGPVGRVRVGLLHRQEQAIEYLEKSVASDQTDAQSWYLKASTADAVWTRPLMKLADLARTSG